MKYSILVNGTIANSALWECPTESDDIAVIKESFMKCDNMNQVANHDLAIVKDITEEVTKCY